MLPRIVAGDTLNHQVTLTDYPASDGWVMSYRLAPRGAGTVVAFSATASGDDHAFAVPAATTAAWAPGEYTAAAWVAHADGRRHSVVRESGQLRVWPDPATIGAGTDTRSDARKALDNIEATIEGRATSAVLEYQINGRQLRYLSPSELIELQRYFAGKVADQEAEARGIATKGKVYVRMGRA